MSWASAGAVALFLLGVSLLAELVCRFFPALGRRQALLLVLPVALFWGAVLGSGSTSLWTSAIYPQRPFADLEVPPGLPRSTLATDPVLQMTPFRHLVRERLGRGEVPLWTPALGAGSPLLANGQSAVGSLIETMARPWPPVLAATLVAGWQTVVAALLAAALAAALGATPAGAWLAGQGYALSLGMIAWSQYPLGGALAFLPGVLAAVAGLHGERPRSEAALVFSAAALALAGHPETTAQAGFAAALAALAAAASLESTRRRRFSLRALRAAALAFCLAAPVQLPLLAELAESDRRRLLELFPGAAGPPAPELRMLAPIVAPFAFGNPRFDQWAGPWNFYELASSYPGLVAIALALAGALTLRGRALALAAGAVAALLVALDLPPLASVVDAIPLLGETATGRFRMLWVLGVLAAAGWSASRLAASPRGVRGLLFSSLFVAAAAVGTASSYGLDSLSERVQASAALAGLAGVVAVALCARLRHLLPLAAGIALALEGATNAFLVTPGTPARLDLEPPAGFRAALDEALASRPEPAPRFAALDWDAHPNLAALWGLWDIRPNDPMGPWAPRALLALETAGRELPGALPRLSRGDGHAFERWGVRFLLTPRRVDPGPGWRTLWRAGSSRLSERISPRPIFFFPRELEPAPDRVAALERAAAREDLGVVGVERPSSGHDAAGADVAAIRPISNGFDLTLRTRAPALLASTVAWGTGWRAELAGDALAVERVDGAFVGVAVPAVAGPATLRLRYRPPSWRLGCGLAVAALLATGAWRLLGPALRRRPAGAGG